MAYGAAPQTDTSDAIRVLVGDVGTSTSTTYLDDAEYDYFTSVSSNAWGAAQLAANSLAALFAGAAASSIGGGYIEKSVGDLKLKKADAAQVAQSYRSLAHTFGRRAAAGITPYAGGITISDKASVESDTDRVRPAFLMRLYDNQQTMDAARPSTST